MIIRIENVNDVILITDAHKKVIFDLINRDEFPDVILTGITSFINQIYTSSLKNLKEIWIDKFKKEGVSISDSEEGLLMEIFAHPEYLDRKDREIEAQAIRTSQFNIK